MESQVKIPVNVYAESTPNPAALKFVCSILLLNEGSITYNHPSEAENCPLAQQLFAFTGVNSVFISSNFVTVTKAGDIEWFEIMGIIREFIRGYLMSGEKVFTGTPENSSDKPQAGPAENTMRRDASEVENQIVQMLEEYVKPAVEQDGGAIDFRSFEDGVVTVVLKGSCSGCPSSTMTLKSGIENLLRQMVPEVKSVVAES